MIVKQSLASAVDTLYKKSVKVESYRKRAALSQMAQNTKKSQRKTDEDIYHYSGLIHSFYFYSLWNL